LLAFRKCLDTWLYVEDAFLFYLFYCLPECQNMGYAVGVLSLVAG
ncbi:13084_t:CDS:1, partial [Funneliformis mosseae]